MNHRRLFLDLLKKRAPLYRGYPKTVIERKLDKLLGHNSVLLESVADVTSHITVPYAVIGGHAVAIHGTPRMTDDIDIITDSPESVRQIVSDLGLQIHNKLTIGGVAAKTPSGIEIDIIAPDQEWVSGLLSHTEKSKHGRVVSKPYLVLTKIWAARGVQDDTDTINVLKKMDEKEQKMTIALVDKYFPNMSDDIRSMAEIAEMGINL